MSEGGKRMSSRNAGTLLYLSVFMFVAAIPATSQSFRVQCPTSTITHPDSGNAGVNNAEPAYIAPTFTGTQGYVANGAGHVNGAIKCQQISGGDGYATMGDGTQTYMFSFGPLSGLSDIALGLPGTEFPSTFNNVYAGTLVPGDPATTDYAGGAFTWNGAVGLIGDPNSTVANAAGKLAAGTAVVAGGIIEDVTIINAGSGYLGPATVTFGPPTCTPGPACATAVGTVEISGGKITGVDVGFAGEGYTTTPSVTFSAPVIGCTGQNLSGCLDGHVDPRPMMDVGVMNGNIPAPLMAIDEDDEFFLT
jgi:hypothetical protein